MNQDAFRNLLSSSSSSSTSGSRPAFGSTQKRPRPATGGRKNSGEDDDYRKQPRKDDEEEQPERKQFGPKWNSSTGEAYVDRAAARRQGQEPTGEDEEDASVRALHEEWRQKWLAADGEEARREVEEQMAFLGGDAKHSILVKGLDWALLAQQRAKAGESGGSGRVEDDDDLEAAYATARRDHDDETGPSTAASPGQSSSTKRSRQEILEALKRRKLDRSGASASASPPLPQLSEEEQGKLREAEEEKQRLKGKFRPIGASGSGGADEKKKGEVIITKDGKRLRKKVKKVEEQPTAQKAGQPAAASSPSSSSTSKVTAPTGAAGAAAKPAHTGPAPKKDRDFAPRQLKKSSTAAPAAGPAAPDEKAQPSPPATAAPHASNDAAVGPSAQIPSTTASATKAAVPEDDDDDDEDIFADAGRWSGLDAADDDDDDNEEEAKAQVKETVDDANLPLLPALSASGRRDWFGDGDEEDEQASKETLPAGSPSLPLPPAPPGPSSQQDAAAEDSSPGPSTTRLQGLSDSALPSDYSRYLLDQEKEREERKAKKREEALKERMQKKRERKKALREAGGAEGEGGA